MPYPVMNTLLDAGFPAGSLNYWLSSFTRGLPDELIDIAVERFATVPSPMTAILLEHFHGAVTRVGATETAVPHRDEGWNLLIPSVWTDPADTEANIAWSRETFAAMRPHFATGRWLNYLGDDQAEDAIRAAYGPNYDRLGGQAAVRPGQRLPPQPQHRAVARGAPSLRTNRACPDDHLGRPVRQVDRRRPGPHTAAGSGTGAGAGVLAQPRRGHSACRICARGRSRAGMRQV